MLKLRTFSRIILLAACLAAAQISLARDVNDVRLLYWNIQNGMWADQQNNYNNFVDFVKSQDPDICVWCEGASIYYSGTADYLKTNDEKYLPYNWDELAARYGHNYVYVGGWRDDYPQVVTSKFPIKNVKRILGNPDDVIVSHGAGWVQIEVQGQTLNLVTLHTWPHQHAYMAEDQEKSKAENGGHKYRAREMKFICDNTINTVPDARNQYWMMMGDFNARSRVDAAQYDYPEDSPAYLVHDYIKANTPYRDVIASWNGKKFVPSVAGGSRIDFIYATAPMVNRIRDARIYPMEGWLKPVRDPKNLSNFYHPSDHLPIVVDFNLGSKTSKAELNPEWHDLKDGAQWATIESEIFGGKQFISVFRYPARKFITEVANDPGLTKPRKPEYPSAVDPEKPAAKTSVFGERYGALAAINAGYFNMRTLFPVTYVKDGGEQEGRTSADEMERSNGVVAFKGHKVEIFYCDSLGYEKRLKNYDEAISCGPVLIENGVVQDNWPDSGFYFCRHPRSLIGTSANGYVYFVVIDGRFHGQGEGTTIPETAEIARALGMTNALNLDGGGSSALWVNSLGVLGHPCDNGKWDHVGERTVPNVIIVK